MVNQTDRRESVHKTMSLKNNKSKKMQVIDSDDEPQENDEKKIENFEFELDQVYDMLNRLTSKDKNVSRFVGQFIKVCCTIH